MYEAQIDYNGPDLCLIPTEMCRGDAPLRPMYVYDPIGLRSGAARGKPLTRGLLLLSF